MLVLSRKQGERLVVTVAASDTPTTFEIELVRGERAKSRLGFAAPATVQIARKELLADDAANGEEGRAA